MATRFSLKVGLFTLGIGLVGCERSVSFTDDVQPIFRQRCAECHTPAGEGFTTSGFSVSDYDSVMSGTKFGAVVIPGESISSSLYLVVAQKTAPEIQMPPHHNQSLSVGRGTALPEHEVEIIRIWIDQGAKQN